MRAIPRRSGPHAPSPAPPGLGRRRHRVDLGLDRGPGRRTRPPHPKAHPRSCILLWMNGGPSQMDTFDLKPGHANGGPFKAIETAVPGLRISEHLPNWPADAGCRPDPLDEHQGRRPRPRHLPLADRLHAAGPDPVPVARRARGQGAGRPGRRAAELRQHRARPGLQPRRVRPGFLGPSTPPWSSATRPVRLPPARTYRGVAEGPGPRTAAGVDLQRSDARLGLLEGLNADFVAEHPGDSAARHQRRVRAGREADALAPASRRSTWTTSRPRCATPTAATRSARAACWPAGWSSAACRSSR